MYRSILVPLDGSSFGEHALPLALSVARRAQAQVQLLHVHVPLQSIYTEAHLFTDFDLDFHLKERGQGYLQDVAKRISMNTPVPVTATLMEGEVATTIRATATSTQADLVVMATHGRGPLGRLWLGSVVDRLIRELPMPLLLVRPTEAPADLASDPAPKNILLPLDGTALAEQIIEPAVAFGRLMDADHTLLRVVKPVAPVYLPLEGANLMEMSQSALDEIARVQERLRREAQDYLGHVADRLRSEGLRVRTRVEVEHQAALAILHAGTAPAFDLIAMETHGRWGMSRMVLGSVADKVLRGSSLPMLVHRPAYP